jgi:hypothetical protein
MRVEMRRGWSTIGGWLRPRLAPLAITAFATLCMLAALDLVAGPIRAARARIHTTEPVPIFLMAAPRPQAAQRVVEVNVVDVDEIPPICGDP